MSLHIPENALPSDLSPCKINIQASLSGQYEFPPQTKFVSGVYWIAFPKKLRKPVSVEVQYCAYPNQCPHLSFVRASCAQKELPYKFQYLEGGLFTPHNSYGSISVAHFPGIAIVKRKRPLDEQDETEGTEGTTLSKIDSKPNRQVRVEAEASVDSASLVANVHSEDVRYSSQVYYIPKDSNNWRLDFVLFSDLELCNAVSYHGMCTQTSW